MELHVSIGNGTLPLDAIEAGLCALDPSALLDLDAEHGLLRVSTLLDADRLRAVLAAAGVAVDAAAVRQLPSICCGGCGG